MQTPSIAVIGAGSWGTALAILLSRNGQAPTLWGRDPAHLAQLDAERCNHRYLPGYSFPPQLRVCRDFAEAIGAARDILIVVPSRGFHDVLRALAGSAMTGKRVAWATKGFEPESGQLLHEVLAEVLGPNTPCAVLSGPTFAAEVARGLPAAVTVASQRLDLARDLSVRFHNPRFRVYTSDDIIGVEVGGAVKNALALAAGIADGLGFGANTRAALITRGMAELMRLGVALGGRRETFMGLTGLGDLVLTCTDDQSRNRRAGLVLGRGGSLADAQASVGEVIEGVWAAREIARIARRLGVEMPITEQVNEILYQGRDPRDAVRALLARAAGAEV